MYKYLYIPSNIDLSDLEKKIPQNLTISRDRIGFIITNLLHLESSRSSHQIIENGVEYTCMHSTVLKMYVYNYKEVIDLLLENEIVSRTKGYEAGKNSYGYKINSISNSYINTYTWTDLQFQHSLNRKTNSRKINELIGLTSYPKLDRWINDPNFKFDATKAKAILSYFISNGISNQKNLSYSYAIARCEHRDYWHGRDSVTSRYHSPLTNIKSEFRSCFKYKNQNLVQIDITNCQPYLLQTIFQEDFVTSKYPQLCNKQFKIKDTSYLMFPKTSVSLEKADYLEYIHSVNSGSFYEDFLLRIKQKSSYNLERKEVKIAIYQTFFSDNRWCNNNTFNPIWDASLKRLFIECYPTVYEGIKITKKGDNTRLAKLLQRIESHLIIDVCVQRISKEKPQCPIYTIHDSISTTEEYVGYVKSIIQEEFKSFVGFDPIVDIKSW